MSDPLDGVTDETVTLAVSVGQFAALSETAVSTERARVTHKISVGPFALPGLWVVTGASRRSEPPKSDHWITLSRLAD